VDEVYQRKRTSEKIAKTIKALSTSSFGVPDQLYEGYVFDLDGTIYLGDELLPGARRLVLKLHELGKRVVFLSNNPTKGPHQRSRDVCGEADEPRHRNACIRHS
jgi:ribonucleotide monophosphatase NagD (HAD superfamily)